MSAPIFRVTIGPVEETSPLDLTLDEVDMYYVQSSDFEFELNTGEAIIIERVLQVPDGEALD